MGLLNNVIPFFLIVWGQKYIQGGEAAILNATMPIFALVMGLFLSRNEYISATQIVGIAVGFIRGDFDGGPRHLHDRRQ